VSTPRRLPAFCTFMLNKGELEGPPCSAADGEAPYHEPPEGRHGRHGECPSSFFRVDHYGIGCSGWLRVTIDTAKAPLWARPRRGMPWGGAPLPDGFWVLPKEDMAVRAADPLMPILEPDPIPPRNCAVLTYLGDALRETSTGCATTVPINVQAPTRGRRRKSSGIT